MMIGQKDHQQLLGFVEREFKLGLRQLLFCQVFTGFDTLLASPFELFPFSNGEDRLGLVEGCCWQLELLGLGQGSPKGLLLAGGLTQLLDEVLVFVGLRLGFIGVKLSQFLLPLPVPPTYFYCIFEGLMPPGLFTMLAHLGMCLSATSGAYFLPQYLHSTQWSQLERTGGGKSDNLPPLAQQAFICLIIFIAFCSSSCWIFHLGFFYLPKLGFMFGLDYCFIYTYFFDLTSTLSPWQTLSCLPTLSALNFLPQFRQGTRFPIC